VSYYYIFHGPWSGSGHFTAMEQGEGVEHVEAMRIQNCSADAQCGTEQQVNEKQYN
jgi:hypothetical protein